MKERKKKAFFGRLRIFMVRRHSNKQELSGKDVCVHNIVINDDDDDDDDDASIL
jgi:hypothetical protein